ncbi:MAG: hypothetical protein U0325_08330 [Polyangiales bacterium]
MQRAQQRHEEALGLAGARARGHQGAAVAPEELLEGSRLVLVHRREEQRALGVQGGVGDGAREFVEEARGDLGDLQGPVVLRATPVTRRSFDEGILREQSAFEGGLQQAPARLDEHRVVQGIGTFEVPRELNAKALHQPRRGVAVVLGASTSRRGRGAVGARVSARVPTLEGVGDDGKLRVEDPGPKVVGHEVLEQRVEEGVADLLHSLEADPILRADLRAHEARGVEVCQRGVAERRKRDGLHSTASLSTIPRRSCNTVRISAQALRGTDQRLPDGSRVTSQPEAMR